MRLQGRKRQALALPDKFVLVMDLQETTVGKQFDAHRPAQVRLVSDVAAAIRLHVPARVSAKDHCVHAGAVKWTTRTAKSGWVMQQHFHPNWNMQEHWLDMCVGCACRLLTHCTMLAQTPACLAWWLISAVHMSFPGLALCKSSERVSRTSGGFNDTHAMLLDVQTNIDANLAFILVK